MDRDAVTRSCLSCDAVRCSVCSDFSMWHADAVVAAPLKAPSAFSKQIAGSHYTDCAIQPFEYSMANKLDPMQHTIVKYVTRFRSKNGIEDLKKAKHTLELLIEWEEKNGIKAK